jgi:hypothetical protein
MNKNKSQKNEALFYSVKNSLEHALEDYWNRRDLYRFYDDKNYYKAFVKNLEMLQKTKNNHILKEYAFLGSKIQNAKPIHQTIKAGYRKIGVFLYQYFGDYDMNAIDYLEDFLPQDIDNLNQSDLNRILKLRPPSPTTENDEKAMIELATGFDGVWRPDIVGKDDLSQEIPETADLIQLARRTPYKDLPMSVEELEEIIISPFSLTDHEPDPLPQAHSPKPCKKRTRDDISVEEGEIADDELDSSSILDPTSTLPSLESLLEEGRKKPKRRKPEMLASSDECVELWEAELQDLKIPSLDY